MADSESRQSVIGVCSGGATENVPCPACKMQSRPRLGDGHDSWPTVLKDMLREAPKTGLVVLATLATAIVHALSYLFVVLAGGSGQPLGVLSIRWLVGAVVDLLGR